MAKPALAKVKVNLSQTESQATTVPSANGAPSSEQIARLAYSYWEARGRQGGSPEEDWLRAEEALRNQSSQTQTSHSRASHLV